MRFSTLLDRKAGLRGPKLYLIPQMGLDSCDAEQSNRCALNSWELVRFCHGPF